MSGGPARAVIVSESGGRRGGVGAERRPVAGVVDVVVVALARDDVTDDVEDTGRFGNTCGECDTGDTGDNDVCEDGDNDATVGPGTDDCGATARRTSPGDSGGVESSSSMVSVGGERGSLARRSFSFVVTGKAVVFTVGACDAVAVTVGAPVDLTGIRLGERGRPLCSGMSRSWMLFLPECQA